MQSPLEISYRNVVKTNEIENLIREKVNKLETVCDYITSAHIAVEKPQTSIDSGSPYRFRISVRMPPGHEVVVKREPGEGSMNDSLTSIIRDGFEAARRKLKEMVDIQRSEVKSHPEQEMTAIISELNQNEGYGFIRTLNGRDIYFHKNSVLHNDFENLKPGNGVRFFEEQGEKGPQASTIQIVDGSQPGT